MSFNTDEIIQSYFENHSLVQHQINSFNVLVDDIIPNIFSQYFPISLDLIFIKGYYFFMKIFKYYFFISFCIFL